MFDSVLKTLCGNIHFMVLIGNHPALELKLEGKNIIVEVINPLLAIEFGIEELLKNRNIQTSQIIQFLKGLGYRIKIKYKFLELEI